MFPPPAPLLPVSGADAELIYAAVAQKLMAPSDHAGMGQLRTQVIIPQIGVGIEMYDMEIRIFLPHGPDGRQSYQMFPANHKRHFSIFYYLSRPHFQVGQGCLRTAEAQLQISAVKYGAVKQVFILVWGIALQTVRLRAHRPGTEPGSGPVGGGGIKRCAV